MATNKYAEEIDRWKTLSLLLLLLLGLVGGLSYNLLVKQKAIIEDQELQIVYLTKDLSAKAQQVSKK